MTRRGLCNAAVLVLAGLCGSATLHARQLDVKFSCSAERSDRNGSGMPGLYADSGEIHLRGDTVVSFHWESSLFRRTHGFDCSIDDSDGLHAEALPLQAGAGERWRVWLRDGRLARLRRGYDADHGLNCSIRLARQDDVLRITPSCPALCGSRENFSPLTVSLKTGQCDYEH